MNRLTKDYFARDARVVARELLGKVIVVRGRELVIAETEAYLGEEDLASHARFGMTKRSSVMWGEAGRLYVYLIYGLHEMTNIVTGELGRPQAVLLRAGVTPDGKEIKGPGLLTKYLGLTRADNAKDLVTDGEIWVVDGGISVVKVRAVERVGVGYAGKWAKKKWRYMTTLS